MICPRCGNESKYQSPTFCERCGAPMQQAPVQQTPVQQTPVQQAPVQMPVQQPVQQPVKKRRRVKWWMIVLPLLVAALAAGGIYYARTQKQYTAAVHYDEDGEWFATDYFDKDGLENGLRTPEGGVSGWKETGIAKEFDLSEDKKVKGADRVVCLQSYSKSDGEESFGNYVRILAYDKDDRLIRVRELEQPLDSYTWEVRSIETYEYYSSGKKRCRTIEHYHDDEVYSTQTIQFNRRGNVIWKEERAADGALMSRTEYENSYFLGVLRKVKATTTVYLSGNYETEAYGDYTKKDKPETDEWEWAYEYSFGLRTACVTTEYDDDGEPFQHRTEYEYD